MSVIISLLNSSVLFCFWRLFYAYEILQLNLQWSVRQLTVFNSCCTSAIPSSSNAATCLHNLLSPANIFESCFSCVCQWRQMGGGISCNCHGQRMPLCGVVVTVVKSTCPLGTMSDQICLWYSLGLSWIFSAPSLQSGNFRFSVNVLFMVAQFDKYSSRSEVSALWRILCADRFSVPWVVGTVWNVL